MATEITMLGGNCPVQAEGSIDGHKFDFRARGNRWTINIAGEAGSDLDWHYEQPYGDEPFAAGYMREDEARAFIEQSAERYRQSKIAVPGTPEL